MNDIGNAVPNEKVKLFADDTNLFVFENSSAALNKKSNFCINELNKWFIANKLSLNLTKTCYMVLSTKHCDNFVVRSGLHVTEKFDNSRYLEIIIDAELKWLSHVEKIYSKLVKPSSGNLFKNHKFGNLG